MIKLNLYENSLVCFCFSYDFSPIISKKGCNALTPRCALYSRRTFTTRTMHS